MALLPDYYEDTERDQRWQVLRRRIGPQVDGPALLVDAGEELRTFLGPVCDSLIEGRPFTQVWSPRWAVASGGSGSGRRRRAVTETSHWTEEEAPRRFQRYPEYRDSDIEWLPEIPAHWDSTRLRFVVETRLSKKEVSTFNPETEVSFVPMEAIREYGGLSLDSTKPLSEVLDAYTYFRDGDVIVAKITPCFENGKGALAKGLSSSVGFGTTELHVLRPSSEVEARFLLYLTFGNHFRFIGEASMYGAGGQKRISGDFVRNFRHPLPSFSEQQAIADFLDRETAKIDALVAKKERLIDLLQEKRTALITRAVTRGLDPNAPMKDSGVEWLGEIPMHWDVKRVKNLSGLRYQWVTRLGRVLFERGSVVLADRQCTV